MYTTYITPTETPPTSLEIKRALLTYDRVLLPDPDDRDYFPSHLYMSAMTGGMGFPFPLAMSFGPIRPLGKVDDYDNKFDQLMEEINYGRRQGLIDVVSMYNRDSEKHIHLGSAPTGEYPLNPTFMLWAYRNLSRDQDALAAAVAYDRLIVDGSLEQISALAGDNAAADGAINDDPALPDIEAGILRHELTSEISKIARARLAFTMRAIGYCASKQLAPTISNSNIRNVALHINRRSQKFIDVIQEDDPYFIARDKVLQIAHSEYINEDVLAKMSIDEVISLRTTAWGEQTERRDQMLQSAAALSRDVMEPQAFEREISREISEYRSKWDSVISERRGLDFQINCEIAKTASVSSAAILGGELKGNLTMVQSAGGAAILLLAGCAYAIEKIKDFAPARKQIRDAEEELKDYACFGLHNFYRSLSPDHASGRA